MCLNRGFTLVEIMVALFVFSLLSGFAFRAVSDLSLAASAVKNDAVLLEDMQKIMSFAEKDIRSSVKIRVFSDVGESNYLINFLSEGNKGIHFEWSSYTFKDNMLCRKIIRTPDVNDDDALGFCVTRVSDFAFGKVSDQCEQGCFRFSIVHDVLGKCERIFSSLKAIEPSSLN